MRLRFAGLATALVIATLGVTATTATAAPANGGGVVQPASGGAAHSAKPKKHSCPLGTVLVQTVPVAPIVNAITGDTTDTHCDPVSVGVSAAGKGAAALGNAAAGAVLAPIAQWFVGGAKTAGGMVASAMKSTSTPALSSRWFQSTYGMMVKLGLALAGLAAMIGVMSAALKRSPEDLSGVIYGVFRAGLLAGLVLPLTAITLSMADGISADVMTRMPADLVTTLQSGWGASNLGAFASNFVATVIAFFDVLIALVVWIELLFRYAAIVLAVAFIAVTLGLAVWPRLTGMYHKLLGTLAVFVFMKPVVLIVLLLGSQLLAGGLSASAGVGKSVGAVIGGFIILSMAAFAPWTILRFAGLDAGSVGRHRSRSSESNNSSESSSSTSTESAAALAGGGAAVAGAAAGGVAAAGASGGGGGAKGGSAAGGAPGGRAAAGSGASSNGASSNGASDAGGGRTTIPAAMGVAAGWMGGAGSAAVGAVRGAATAGQNIAEHGAARMHAGTGGGGVAPGQNPVQSLGFGGSPSGASASAGGAAGYPRSQPPNVDASAPASSNGGPEPAPSPPPSRPLSPPPTD